MKLSNIIAVLVIIGFTMLTRLVHIGDIPQFNALLASAALMGFVIRDIKWAVIAALFMMIIGDMILGSYDALTTIVNYIAVVSIVLMTSSLRNYNLKNTAIAAILGPVLFFLISNMGVFLFGQPQMYPHTLAGLIDCYVMAIPFAKGTFIGSILYSAIYYALYHYLPISALGLSKSEG